MITRRLVGFIAGAALLLTLAGVAGNAEQFTLTEGRSFETSNETSRGTRTGAEDPQDDFVVPPGERERAELPEWIGQVITVLAATAAGLGTIWFLARNRFTLSLRRRQPTVVRTRTPMSEEEQAETIADFADELIAELEFGEEPRVAIQRVYAAVETGLGSWELRRRPAETPLQYLDRVFGRRRSAAPALARLTDLFQVARFSEEPLDDSARLAAIGALRELRDDYRAVARARFAR